MKSTFLLWVWASSPSLDLVFFCLKHLGNTDTCTGCNTLKCILSLNLVQFVFWGNMSLQFSLATTRSHCGAILVFQAPCMGFSFSLWCEIDYISSVLLWTQWSLDSTEVQGLQLQCMTGFILCLPTWLLWAPLWGLWVLLMAMHH